MGKDSKKLPYPLGNSKLPPEYFNAYLEEEKKRYPFSSVYIGCRNPYTQKIVYSEADYFEYLREHTYYKICDMYTAEAAKREAESAEKKVQSKISSIEAVRSQLEQRLQSEKAGRRRLRIVSIVLLILLLASVITASSLRSSGRTYEDGYAAGESAGKDAGYQTGYAKGKDEGYNDGWYKGYWEGYADAGERSTGTGDSHGSGTGTHTGTGSTRETAIADTYIGNTSSKKFHLPTCSYLPDAANQITFDSRDEAIAAGYDPCGHCHP